VRQASGASEQASKKVSKRANNNNNKQESKKARRQEGKKARRQEGKQNKSKEVAAHRLKLHLVFIGSLGVLVKRNYCRPQGLQTHF